MIECPDSETHVVYTAFITLKNGTRIYAKNYGLRAFRIYVKNAE